MELGLGLHGANLTAFPIGLLDVDGWHRNITINDTFRTQEIDTFKEVHCEIKKCDVNALAAVGGEFYVSKPSASRDLRYQGDVGSTADYTCSDISLSARTPGYKLECVDNKFYYTDDVRGVWRNVADPVPTTAIALSLHRDRISCTVEECYEVQGDRYGFESSPTWPYQAYNKPTLDSWDKAQSHSPGVCSASLADFASVPCGLDA